MTYIGDYVRTVPTTYQGSRNMVSMIVNLFQHYKDLTNEQTLYTEALQTLLPYSFIEYSDFLYASNQLKNGLNYRCFFNMTALNMTSKR